ncbi:hypothetical protein FISHEDRAFT_46347 [Fistulina hepatica ATCC 64428]|uniref:Phosphomethylpyrimidine kinase n=1 Tax=Fistulina hepatica ATCC 64428 TaxID=1128425 RepID=A0A0D7AAG1_9AGAR|nr:hypothetical protein FISHEDRAFT_46347 [Fistulina hepatica ATCC 64428]
MSVDRVRAVMTIAGSDSGGGAGIQADLKTIAALGCFGTSAITSLTAQNTLGVQDIYPCPPSFVETQIASITCDIDVDAIKTGMLYDGDTIQAVARALKAAFPGPRRPPMVCDPVCVSTSGHTLLRPNAIDTLVDELFPHATLVTPNKPEAELLLSTRQCETEIRSLKTMLSAAEQILKMGPTAVLIKGGHLTTTMSEVEDFVKHHAAVELFKDGGVLSSNMEMLLKRRSTESAQELVVDLLLTSEKTYIFISPRIESSSTHGTGCTLSSAIACGLSQGLTVQNAVRLAVNYTHGGITAAYPIGKGHGPLNHLHNLQPSCLPRRSNTDPYPFTRLLVEATTDTWKAYVEHDFVVQLGKGTLAKERFVHFIKQDYYYLKYYARAYGLLASKSSSFDAMDSAAQTILNVTREINTHRTFCALFGVSAEELEATPESTATTAYGCYLIETGMQGNRTKLLMALLACLLGYGEVGLWLKKQATLPDTWVRLEENPYARWIEDYSGEVYQNAVQAGLDVIEDAAAEDPPTPARFAEWRSVWRKCTQLEKAFWDMAMDLS